MIFAAVLLGVCQLVTMLGVVLFIRHAFNAKQAELEARAEAKYHEWFDHQEGKPHKFAEAVNAVGAVIGSAAAQSIMASLSAEKSHAARAANGEADAALGNAVPIMGLLTGGKRGRAAAMMQLMSTLGGLGGGAPSNGDNGKDGLSDVESRIWKR